MPKNQTKASTPVPAQESRSPVSFDVRVYPVKDSKYTLANANVDINGVFAIRGVKVIRGEKGPFVAMPQYKDSHGDYHDICFPCTKEARQQPLHEGGPPAVQRCGAECLRAVARAGPAAGQCSRRGAGHVSHPQHKTYNLEEIIT